MKKIIKKAGIFISKNILGIIIGGIIFGTVGVYASTTIASNLVSYNNSNSGLSSTTVQGALDELNSVYVNGKSLIANALTNKGIETNSTDSFETIAENINNMSTGNPNLRWNEETSYVEILNDNNEWIEIYKTSVVPIPSWDGYLVKGSSLITSKYFRSGFQRFDLSGSGNNSASAFEIYNKYDFDRLAIVANHTYDFSYYEDQDWGSTVTVIDSKGKTVRQNLNKGNSTTIIDISSCSGSIKIYLSIWNPAFHGGASHITVSNMYLYQQY